MNSGNTLKALAVAVLSLATASQAAAPKIKDRFSVGVLSMVRPIVCGVYLGLYWLGGVVLMFMLVYGGIKYLLSEDDPAERKKAKDIIKVCIIGAILIILTGWVVDLFFSGEGATIQTTILLAGKLKACDPTLHYTPGYIVPPTMLPMIWGLI